MIEFLKQQASQENLQSLQSSFVEIASLADLMSKGRLRSLPHGEMLGGQHIHR